MFNCDIGLPWHCIGVLPVGHSERTYCILLPPDVKPGEPLRLRQLIHYRGLLGLWDVRVPLPDVVDPPGALPPETTERQSLRSLECLARCPDGVPGFFAFLQVASGKPAYWRPAL